MYQYKVTIRRVVDGDTVDVDIDLGFNVTLTDQRIRLAGIDAPESRTSDKIEKVYGIMAKEFVKETIPEGSEQILLSKEYNSRGKFNRILGDFQLDESTLCKQMVERYLAVPYHGQSKLDIKEAHLTNRKNLETGEPNV